MGDATAIEPFKEVAALGGGEVNVGPLEVIDTFMETICRHSALSGNVKFAGENDGVGIMVYTPHVG